MSATNFYEVLGIRKDATQEEVRKAYRKRALQTHPDRLPQDASVDDKKTAAEHFRLVNNAYEVLNNEDNRKLYDRYNVWPPPADRPEYNRRPSQSSFPSDAFANDPFFNSSPFGGGSGGGGGRGRPRAGFAFTDPFELFNSLFGDLHRAFENDPFFAGTPFSRSPFDDPFFRSPFGDPFSRGPFGGGGGLLFGGGSPFMALMGPGMAFPQLEGGQSNVYSSRTEAVGVNGQWVSRSQMTRTVNGRTEVITKRIDAEGNEHVSYSSPDGERYTINGIEQPARSLPIEGPRRSGTTPSSRQPPQPIADAPAQPASHYVPPPQSHAYSVPISGPAPTQTQTQTQTQVSPLANATGAAYLDRAHSHRSHRSRPSADDAPRRSHTTPQPTATPAERPYGGRGSSAGAYDSRTNGGAYASSPTDAYGPRAGSAHGYYAHDRDRDRESRRESVQSGGRDSHSTTHHHHHHHRTSESPLASVRSSEKTRARSTRHGHDSQEYYEREQRELDREREVRNGHASTAQRGWRGW